VLAVENKMTKKKKTTSKHGKNIGEMFQQKRLAAASTRRANVVGPATLQPPTASSATLSKKDVCFSASPFLL
jgi:hypothetical protein